MKTLKLTLKKQYFDEILNGTKKEEYREVKKHWVVRFCATGSEVGLNYECVYSFSPKKYEQIQFTNGYSKKSPSFVIECKGIELKENIETPLGKGNFFVIKLGKIIDNNKIGDN